MTPKRRALIVDDSSEIRLVMGEVLEDEGFEVAEAADGEEALKTVRTFDPHVIICDLMMPNLDGAGFIQRYRQGPGPHAPVIVASASSKYLGVPVPDEADGYVDKPFDVEVLVSLIYQVLERP